MRSTVGPLLVALGAILLIVGLLAWGGALSWFGRLPGDLRVERPNVRIYVPFVSMLVVSIVLSVLSWIVRRFFR
jgi:membrane protein implicated in regulation of membrane protease activity